MHLKSKSTSFEVFPDELELRFEIVIVILFKQIPKRRTEDFATKAKYFTYSLPLYIVRWHTCVGWLNSRVACSEWGGTLAHLWGGIVCGG